MTIRSKVLFAFAVGLALLILQAALTNHFIAQLQTAANTLDRALHASKAATATVHNIKRMQGELAVYSNLASFPTLLETTAVYMADIDTQLQKIAEQSGLLNSPAASTNALVNAYQATTAEYQALRAQPASLRNEDAIYEQLLYVEESLDSLAEESSKLIIAYEQALDSAIFDQREVRDRPTQAAFGLCALAAILLIVYALYFSAQLTRRIRALADRLRALTDGLVGQPALPVQGVDELADLAVSLNTMERRLIDVIVGIKDGTHSVDLGVGQIAQGNLNLSNRTERQATNLVTTNNTMLELSKTVRQNAANAEEADQLASTAQHQAEVGGAVVDCAITAMRAIGTASKQIADITSVIDDIAFQTNLLALNAAVEAAHAGEQGRGFAVVANEVRNLAQRSTVAAKEIKHLIEDTNQKIDEGTRLVDESGRSLSEIVDAVGNVTLVVTKIADASRTQATGIQEVSGSVQQLEEMTQQNAALVQQAATASETMGNQARLLRDQVAFFDVIEPEPTSLT